MSKSHRAKSAPARRPSRKHLKSRRKSAPGKMQPVLSPNELKKRFEQRKRIALRLRRPLQRRENITRAVHRLSMGGKSRRKSRKPRRSRKSKKSCWTKWFF